MAIKIKDIRYRTPRSNGTRPLSWIKNIARHHSATDDGSWDSFWPHWRDVKKWGTGGYHEIILRDGTIQLCYDPEEITNGVGGQNSYIYHICVVGNGSFTAVQEKAFEERAKYWMTRFNLPVSAVKGHREFPGANTTCPGINMDTVRARLAKGGPVHTAAAPSSGYVLYGELVQLKMRGASVKRMQEDLTKAGFKTAADGIFGNGTRTAVMNFQKAHGLAVDGYMGPASQKKLKEVLGKLNKPQPLGKKLGRVELLQTMNYRSAPSLDAKVFHTLPKGHKCDYYEIKGDWMRLGRGWVSNKGGKYVKVTEVFADKPKPATKPKGTIYRVFVDGKQKGAYAEDDNALAEARRAIASGAKNIKIEKV